MNKSPEEHTSQKLYTADAAAMVRAIDNTGVRMFMYYPQTKTITVPPNTCAAYKCKSFYSNMPHSFADDYVLEQDHEVFKEMYYRIDRGEPYAAAVFHSSNKLFCNKVTLTIVSWTEDGSPREVFGLIEDRSDLYRNEQFIEMLQKKINSGNDDEEINDVLRTIVSAIGSQYSAVFYIWLEDHTYVCIHEQLENFISVMEDRASYGMVYEKYIENYVDAHYIDGVKSFIDMSTLADRIGDRHNISYDFLSKSEGWIRGRFIAGKRDKGGRLLTVIYAISDINEEMEAKRKRKEAEQEVLHDPLTQLWNRKAFDQFKKSDAFRNNKTGLILFDIDRFKSINDRFGHETGDQVIKAVCENVRDTLMSNDMLFRIGGDEFAVLIFNCSEYIWSYLCRQVRNIHENLKKTLSENIDATISVGLCVSKDGYSDSMFNYADQAMYNTKANGRGGCTMISLDGEILKEWHDSDAVLRKGDILERNSTMVWKVDLPRKEGLSIRAYGDELFLTFLGLDNTASPEDVYLAWKAGVEPDYFDIVRDAVRTTVYGGSSEAVYLWRHPAKGILQLRCSSSFDSKTDDYYSIIGYTRITTGTHVFTLEDISNNIRSALEELYLCNFYIRLSDYSFKAYKSLEYMNRIIGDSTDGMEVVKKYVADVVEAESREALAEFMNLTSLKMRMKKTNVLECLYRDKCAGRARARFVVVARDELDEVESVSLIIEGI